MAKLKITPMTLNEIATLYNVGYLTFWRWLKPHKEKVGKTLPNTHVYSVKQVALIFSLIGPPYDDIEC